MRCPNPPRRTDGGYDSQHNHHLLCDVYNIESLIPAVHGRPTEALPTNRWRSLMATQFDQETYGQRWRVETVIRRRRTIRVRRSRRTAITPAGAKWDSWP